MTKFLHTADWQLGMTRHFLSDEAQARFTAARIEAITTIGALAVQEGCSFVVVGGDVFESNQVERQVVVRSLEAMKATSGRHLLPAAGQPRPARRRVGVPLEQLRRQLSRQRGRAREQRAGPRRPRASRSSGRPGPTSGRWSIWSLAPWPNCPRRHATSRRRARQHRQPLAQPHRPGTRRTARPRRRHRRRHRALCRPRAIATPPPR